MTWFKHQLGREQSLLVEKRLAYVKVVHSLTYAFDLPAAAGLDKAQTSADLRCACVGLFNVPFELPFEDMLALLSRILLTFTQ